MPKLPLIYLSLFTLLLIATQRTAACSMYKITLHGKTMAGNNEDSWRLTSRIWFEKGDSGKLGAAYVGYSDKAFADGAVNEAGLAWDGFTVPFRKLKDQSSKKHTATILTFMSITRHCRSVDEAYRWLSPMDLSGLNGGMFLMIDSSGKYLVVEADTLITGNDPTYVLANFCPSQTPDLSAVPIARYRNGMAFLKNKQDTAIRFCTALSDTMHMCRPLHGDGTLYTTIYDLKEGLIYLYFYHDFKHPIRFDLKKELAKGDHSLSIPGLFPPNDEYRRLQSYITPQHSSLLRGIFVFLGFAFLFSIIILIPGFFKKNKKEKFSIPKGLKSALILLNLLLVPYLFILFTNQIIFYYPAPYKDYHFSILNVSAYIPYLLLTVLIPFIYFTIRLIRRKALFLFQGALLLFHSATYTLLVILFSYWGFYNIFQ